MDWWREIKQPELALQRELERSAGAFRHVCSAAHHEKRDMHPGSDRTCPVVERYEAAVAALAAFRAGVKP